MHVIRYSLFLSQFWDLLDLIWRKSLKTSSENCIPPPPLPFLYQKACLRGGGGCILGSPPSGKSIICHPLVHTPPPLEGYLQRCVGRGAQKLRAQKCHYVRTRSTTTRDRNLQFRGAVSTGGSPLDFLLFLQVLCVI